MGDEMERPNHMGGFKLRIIWPGGKCQAVWPRRSYFCALLATSLCLLGRTPQGAAQQAPEKNAVNLPSSKVLLSPAPGHPQRTNSFPTAAALSPDGRYLALLNNGRGTAESSYQQSIAILDLSTNQVTDFPDTRLPVDAHQTYFLGLGFSRDGTALYASIASCTDPTGVHPNDTGNGIAVYSFRHGQVAPLRFLRISPQPLAPGESVATDSRERSRPVSGGTGGAYGERRREVVGRRQPFG